MHDEVEKMAMSGPNERRKISPRGRWETSLLEFPAPSEKCKIPKSNVLDVLDVSYPSKDAILISGGRPESSGDGLRPPFPAVPGVVREVAGSSPG